MDTQFVVWRQDDVGHRHIVTTVYSEAEAERIVIELEQLGHKQMYWWCVGQYAGKVAGVA